MRIDIGLIPIYSSPPVLLLATLIVPLVVSGLSKILGETTFERVSVFFKSVNDTFAMTLRIFGSLIVFLKSSVQPFFLATKPFGNDDESNKLPLLENIFMSPFIFSFSNDLSLIWYLTETTT